MPDFTFALNQSISFNGAYAEHGDGTAYVHLGGVEAHYVHTGGPLVVEFGGFEWDDSSPSHMGLDLRLKVNGNAYEPYQRFVDGEASARRFSLVGSASDFPTGEYRFTFEVRSVLLNGPPMAIPVSGIATLRLTTEAKVLAFTIQRPQIINAEVQGLDATVNAYSPDGGPITVSLASRRIGFVKVETPPQVIPAGGTSATFRMQGVSGGIDYLTATASGFQPTVPVQIKIRPVVSRLDPESGKPGSEFNVFGYGFSAGATVFLEYINGNCETVFVDDAHLIARVPDRSSPGKQSVHVEVHGMRSQDEYLNTTQQILFNVVR